MKPIYDGITLRIYITLKISKGIYCNWNISWIWRMSTFLFTSEEVSFQDNDELLI